MHWFDIGVTVFLLLFGMWGLWRGLIREVMSLGGFIVAFVLAAHGYPYAAQLLAGTIATEWLRHALSVALIFIVVMLVAAIISRVLRMLLDVIGLSLLDRFLGGVFGVLKVMLVVSGLLIASGAWAPKFTKQLGAEAALAPLFFHTADMLALVLSQKDYAAFKHLSQNVLQPLQKFVPGPQTLPSAVDKLFPQPSATTPAPGTPGPMAPSSSPPVTPATQRQGLPPGTVPKPSQTPTQPAVAPGLPGTSAPPAQEAAESPESISEADSKALDKLLRKRLQEQRR